MSCKIFIRGVVQGVGFRPAVYRIVKRMGLKGYVRNNGSNVEMGLDRDYKKFLTALRMELPPLARIDDVIIEKTSEKYEHFIILKSRNGVKHSTLPADTGICNDCLKELFDRRNKRYLYPFTNCTNCGARFSLIKDMPYDRRNTSMNDFVLCKSCRKEYLSPEDRRFHAQTTSCPGCGPEYVLYDKNRGIVDTNNPVKEFAMLLDKNVIGVLKGWGGMHICCSLKAVKKMREWYKREQKPFAVMMRNLDTVKRHAEISDAEEKLLTSPQKPVVLLRKKNHHGLSGILKDVSPGLPNIGIMLPYSGLHHVLFHNMRSDGVVMTSANIPGEPMIIRNNDVFELGAECYLLHNRDIISRCDDSVIRVYDERRFFIRKSRGYVPVKIDVDYDGSIVGVGAEQNVSASVSKNKGVYSSQYIGNTTYYPTLTFLEESTGHLMTLLGVNSIDGVGVDLHPRYVTKKFGEKISEKHDAELFRVQHHWAHAVSLMIDSKINEPIIALTLDGAGYGTDGKIWGGEVLLSDYNSFERIGSLEEIPLIGGDAAVKDPRRIVFAILEKTGMENDYFDEKESDLLRKSMKNAPLTTSFGRVLDALSCYLKICQKQTYDGEPAMKLEKYLENGRLKYDFEVEIVDQDRRIVNTVDLFSHLISCSKNKKNSERNKADLSYSFVYHLLKKLTEIAIEKADEKNIRYIGITGGVSYNTAITRIVNDFVKNTDKKFLTHNNIPNGDGGISAGQNAVVGHKLK
ncbi:MAG: carbamoyltransferase HypF [Thermoplasmatales archaeon]|nr:carbamoyltransferase HypF [Thermoplasmatales archaeon]